MKLLSGLLEFIIGLVAFVIALPIFIAVAAIIIISVIVMGLLSLPIFAVIGITSLILGGKDDE